MMDVVGAVKEVFAFLKIWRDPDAMRKRYQLKLDAHYEIAKNTAEDTYRTLRKFVTFIRTEMVFKDGDTTKEGKASRKRLEYFVNEFDRQEEKFSKFD